MFLCGCVGLSSSKTIIFVHLITTLMFQVANLCRYMYVSSRLYALVIIEYECKTVGFAYLICSIQL